MSHRSFSLVDHKVAEAEFFLQKLDECRFDFFSLQCFVAAFIASTRSITFSLQAVLGNGEGFAEWYSRHRNALRSDPTARFFHSFRTVNQHIGDNLVGGGASGPGQPVLYWFAPSLDVQIVPSEDVVTACGRYFRTILAVIFDCYIAFGPLIDAQQRYTAEYFASTGKSIEDAEEEMGMPRGWTDIGDPDSVPYRWQLIRDQAAGCEINDIFERYLGKSTPRPARLPPYVVPQK
jgi:hypothetical protein